MPVYYQRLIMKRWVVAFCCLLAFGQAFAQPDTDVVAVRSASGQFNVYGPRNTGLPFAAAERGGAPGVFILEPLPARLIARGPAVKPGPGIPLEPSLLVTSCEHIKQALLSELGQPDQWRGTIALFINPDLPENHSPVPVQVLQAGRWVYRMALPARMEPQVLLRSIVGVLLMEMANRGAGSQPAEVPFWLAAGLSARLEADNLATLVLRPESHIDLSQQHDPRVDPLRDRFHQQPPITFQELSWPQPEQLTGTNLDFYMASAQLFVGKLLALNDGKSCLRNLVGGLSQHLNWQTSFLEAFGPHFSRLLDVEKWWALTSINYVGLDFALRYGPDESWKNLQRALDVPVEVHFSPDRLPTQAEVNLQEIIGTWEPEKAADALQRVADGLAVLRARLDPDLTELLDGYLSTVRSYLNDTARDKRVWLANYHQSEWVALRNAACKQLDSLDARREGLRAQYLSRTEPASVQGGRNPFAPTPAINR